MSLTARRLLAWDAVERRRRGARPQVYTALAGVLGAAGLIAIERAAGLAEASAWWLALAVVGTALPAMGAPWRFYWRADSALLARLPIAGDVLYRLGAARTALAGLRALAVLLVAAAPVLLVDPGRFAGACATAAEGILAAVLLAPPAAVAAGALVASEKAQRAIDNMTGAGGAPTLVWLSLVPAAAGALVGALPFLGPVPRVATIAGAAILWLAARPLARRVLPEATREVSALDRVQLAHVELERARGLERAVARLSGPARAVYEKDVALARRRYPAYYLWIGAAVLAMWIVAFALGEPRRTRFILGLALGVLAYTAIFARRLARPPVEEPRLLRTLPFPAGAPRRARFTYVAWRAVAPLGLGLLPYLWRL